MAEHLHSRRKSTESNHQLLKDIATTKGHEATHNEVAQAVAVDHGDFRAREAVVRPSESVRKSH